MEHSHKHHTAFLCDGEPWGAHGGSWIGHALPGAVLILWGLHWFISGACHAALTASDDSRRDRDRPAGSAHRIVFLPGPLQNIEPLLKIVLPAVAIILEFSLSGTKYLRCPPGTAKAGEFDVQHMNSWSHGTNYPPLILSGLVDLIHTHWAPLPAGVPHFVLSTAFGISSFLMLSHGKAEPLDALVHRLLGYCMAAVAVSVLLQGATVSVRVVGASRHFGLNAAKSLALIMQGCWFLAITHIMFSTDSTWHASFPGDMTRTMFTPVLFAWILLGVLTFLVTVYLAMHFLLVARHRTHSSCLSRSSSSSSPPTKQQQHQRSGSLLSSSDGGSGGCAPSTSNNKKALHSGIGSEGWWLCGPRDINWRYSRVAGQEQHEHQQGHQQLGVQQAVTIRVDGDASSLSPEGSSSRSSSALSGCEEAGSDTCIELV